MRWHVPVQDIEIPILADDEEGKPIVILAPGAGSHMEHKTLEWLAGIVRKSGARVVRFNFAYRVLGKGVPDRMPKLIGTYRAVIELVRRELGDGPLVIGGHSMGGRVASMLEAEAHTVDGLLLFGYPLHPPDKPDQLRDAHLPSIHVPVLQVNGTEDPFCTLSLMNRVASRLDTALTLKWVEGADHSYGVKKSSGRTRRDVEEEVSATVSDWMGRF